jgi:hypothetical protein
MNIIHCLEENNIQCIKEWAINGFLWYLLGPVIIIGLFFRKFLDIIQAFRLSRVILNKNRITRGNGGYGKRRADIFIDLWLSEKNFNNKISECISSSNSTQTNEFQIGVTVERELQPLKLAEVFEIDDTKKVRAIRNFRNRLVFYFTRFYLVHFIGDNPSYYKKQ